jgi:flagellar hook-associated protein 1 FlgK
VTDERRFAAARDQDPTAAISYAGGDDSNVQALLTLKDREFNFTGLGSVSASGTTLDEMYNITVSRVGSSAKSAKDDYDIFTAREAQIKELQSSVSGVSLDEEFAKLINYQRAFEAAARMVRIADEMFAQIIQISS